MVIGLLYAAGAAIPATLGAALLARYAEMPGRRPVWGRRRRDDRPLHRIVDSREMGRRLDAQRPRHSPPRAI